MASIQEELILVDKFSQPYKYFLSLTENATSATRQMKAAAEASILTARTQAEEYKKVAAAANAQAAELKLQRMQTDAVGDATAGLVSRLRSLAGAYLGVRGLSAMFNMSDQLTATTARLNRMNDGLQTTGELNDMIFQSAMRSRGAYAETASFVAKLGTLAGEAFDSNRELIAFAEQVNKQMALSGTSSQEAQGAMLQLTQGLASGVLRGEELNSVLEQTPMIAQTIARYMGVDVGKMRELASQGAITAEVVKNAMLDVADETNSAFEQMPMTWSQVFTMAGNIAIKALNPLLAAISFTANNLDIIAPIVLSVGAAFWVFLLAARWVSICEGATKAMTAAQQMLGLATTQAWFVPLAAIALVVGAIYAATAIVNRFAGTSVSATGIVAGAFYTAGAFILNSTVIPLMNGFSAFGNFLMNLFNDPVAAIKLLFLDMATTVLGYISNVAHGIENLINAIPGVEMNITSGIDGLYNRVKGAAQNVRDSSEWVEYFKPHEYIDLADAFNSGYSWGENLFSGAGGIGADPFGVPSYDQLSQNVAGIADSVKGIERSVDMSNEDIKSLVDIAERRYVNHINLTSKAPVLNIQGQNTGNTRRDFKNLEQILLNLLAEQTASGAVVSTARA